MATIDGWVSRAAATASRRKRCDELVVGGEVGVEDLDRDPAGEHLVDGLPHLGHAAAGDAAARAGSGRRAAGRAAARSPGGRSGVTGGGPRSERSAERPRRAPTVPERRRAARVGSRGRYAGPGR